MCHTRRTGPGSDRDQGPCSPEHRRPRRESRARPPSCSRPPRQGRRNTARNAHIGNFLHAALINSQAEASQLACLLAGNTTVRQPFITVEMCLPGDRGAVSDFPGVVAPPKSRRRSHL